MIKYVHVQIAVWMLHQKSCIYISYIHVYINIHVYTLITIVNLNL